MEPSQGEHFGRYRLVGIMATGGMARLCLGVMSSVDGFNRVVAIKQVHPHLSSTEDFNAMFLHEARVAARLDHPNIVRVYDLGEIDSQYFISMEYLPGEDLTRIVKKSRKVKRWTPVPIILTIVQRIADALQFAHELPGEDGSELGLVHRDISPSNILVTYHGAVKLADFGIAKATAGGAEETRTGVFKGKFAYSAPEQVKGERVDRRTDIFALGIVLWEALAIKRLFKREADVATIRAVERADIPPLSERRPDIRPELEAVIDRALARDPEKRFQTAQEMSEALEDCLNIYGKRVSDKQIRAWLCDLFGEDVADLKRRVAQGQWIDSSTRYEDGLPFRKHESDLLGIKPLENPSPPRSNTVPLRRERRSQEGSGSISRSVSQSLAAVPKVSWSTDLSQEYSRTFSSIPSGVSHYELPTLPPPGTSEGSVSYTSVTGQREIPRTSQSTTRRSVLTGLGGGLLAVGVFAGALAVRKAIDGEQKAQPGEMALSSEPPGADISIDGQPTGLLTPAKLRNIPTGKSIAVLVTKSGYSPKMFKLVLEPAQSVQRQVRLDKLSRVAFINIPLGARLYVDGRRLRSPQQAMLTSGAHELRVERADGASTTSQIMVFGQNQKIDLSD